MYHIVVYKILPLRYRFGQDDRIKRIVFISFICGQIVFLTNNLINISNKQISFIVKPVLFLLCLVPFLLLVLDAINNNLGTNPVETLTHETGKWALRFLLVTLCVTPLRRLTNAHWIIKLRRNATAFVS